MNLHNNITLDEYSKDANAQFDDMESRLRHVDDSFQTRMDGKTTGRVVASLVGTVVWYAGFLICAFYFEDMVDSTLFIILLAIVGSLFLFMLIDTITDFSYYGKIWFYINSISQLQSRVRIGKNSIESNHDAFMASRVKGWNYLLHAAPSIPNEVASITATLSRMVSLKKSFISGAKSFLFYATVIAITIVVCIALFPTGSYIITKITSIVRDEPFSPVTLRVFNIIALIIAGVGEIILAWLVWSNTDCEVTNKTLFITVAGPISFLVLIIVEALLVIPVTWLAIFLKWFLKILPVLAAVAVVLSSSSGG